MLCRCQRTGILAVDVIFYLYWKIALSNKWLVTLKVTVSNYIPCQWSTSGWWTGILPVVAIH